VGEERIVLVSATRAFFLQQIKSLKQLLA